MIKEAVHEMEFSSGSTDKLSVFVSQENKNYTGFDYTELTFKFLQKVL